MASRRTGEYRLAASLPIVIGSLKLVRRVIMTNNDRGSAGGRADLL